MTLRQSRLLLEALGRADARRLADAAFAARIAQADGKAWTAFVEGVNRGD